MTQVPFHAMPVIEIPVGCGPARSAEPCANGTLFHFSLNVSSLEKSAAFYRILFDAPPAKQYADYVKFELARPPLVFSLVPNPPSSGGSLSHLGFPVASADDVRRAGARLAAAGHEISCQKDTVCGSSRQERIWVADPDRNYWEIYVVHEDIDPESVRLSINGGPPRALAPRPTDAKTEAPAPIIWEHRILTPLPDRIPHIDGTVDEVRLEGLFNDRLDENGRRRLLTESRRVLRPGGRLHVHGLVADRPLPDGPLALPGVAALVSRVPVEREPLDEIAAAGFDRMRIVKLPAAAVFRQGPCEMREIQVDAQKPDPPAPEGENRVVLYKGPFSNVTDDDGQVFRRGERTNVSSRTWERLAASPAAAQFLFVGDSNGACG